MNTKTALRTNNAAKIGSTSVTIQSMYDTSRNSTGLALQLDTDSGIGLSVTLQGTTAEARKLAEAIIRHCDVADAMLRGE